MDGPEVYNEDENKKVKPLCIEEPMQTNTAGIEASKTQTD